MNKVRPKNGNETKSDVFPWNIFKSVTICFFIKKYQNISMISKMKFLNFMTKVNPSTRIETK